MSIIPNAVTIAGSDSGGGAGIQADLKSFSANGVYGASVLTALTAQNTIGVTAIHDVPVEFITAQMDAVFSDLEIHAVKIGMLSQPGVIAAVVGGLRNHGASNIVLDPVMVATSGDLLLAQEAVEAVKAHLMPVADVVTPNLYEASVLTGRPLAEDEEEMIIQAKMICDLGANNVLIKGGHGDGEQCADYLHGKNIGAWFRENRVATNNTHGTGCSLSSAIAANLAHGKSLQDAVASAKTWLTHAIMASDELNVGKGSGPVHHFHDLWSI